MLRGRSAEHETGEPAVRHHRLLARVTQAHDARDLRRVAGTNEDFRANFSDRDVESALTQPIAGKQALLADDGAKIGKKCGVGHAVCSRVARYQCKQLFVLRRRELREQRLIQRLHVSRHVRRTGHEDAPVDQQIRRRRHAETTQSPLFGNDVVASLRRVAERFQRRSS